MSPKKSLKSAPYICWLNMSGSNPNHSGPTGETGHIDISPYTISDPMRHIISAQ